MILAWLHWSPDQARKERPHRLEALGGDSLQGRGGSVTLERVGVQFLTAVITDERR
jgi:hypothetical protein